MNIFLDTNVIIDLIQRREGYEVVARILQEAENGTHLFYTSTLSMVNIAYILRKFYRGASLYGLLNDLREIITVISVSHSAYDNALKAKAKDFEDAVQFFSALEGNMDCIITRNVDDFIQEQLPIYAPSDFLENHNDY